jgi:tetratricopeptide (TPR) repeat protein
MAKRCKELKLQEGYPTVILLTSDKKEIDRLIGLIPEKDYFQKIKDYTNSINTFDDLLKKEKEIKEQLAIKYSARGNFTKAIEYYLPLTEEEIFNSDGRIYIKIASWYSFLNNIEKSKEYAIKAINKNPSEKYYKEFLEKLKSK